VKESIYPGSSSAFSSRMSKKEPNNNFAEHVLITANSLNKIEVWCRTQLFPAYSFSQVFIFTCRAAFLCGREPNFELSEEEKQELRQYKWDEFLEKTRSAINDKSKMKLFSIDCIPCLTMNHTELVMVDFVLQSTRESLLQGGERSQRLTCQIATGNMREAPLFHPCRMMMKMLMPIHVSCKY
ncbi:hypothetical protein BHM03_00044798, partial [Ensete ventricosum]